MNIERVKDHFIGLSGLSEEEAAPRRFLCEMSLDDIGEMLPESPSQDMQEKAEYAAAALAYYRFILGLMTSGGTDSVTVGQVSVHYSPDRLEYAERLYNEALARLGVCPGTGGFVFYGFD